MRKLLVICVSACLLAFAPKPPADLKLEYTFGMGDELEWNQSAKQAITQTIMGMDQEVKTNVASGLLLKVVKLTPTGAQLEARYKTLMLQTALPMGMGEYGLNSQGAQDKPENQIAKAITDKPFTVYMTRLGEVEKVEGTENLWSGFDKVEMDADKKAKLKEQLQQSFNDESVKAQLEAGLMRYPNKPIKTGDTWMSKSNMPLTFPLSANNTWSVGDITEALVKVNCKSAIETYDKNKVIVVPPGLKSKMDMSGTLKLDGAVNPKTGWPSQVKTTSEIKGIMTLLAGGMIPTDMDVPMLIKMETTYTIRVKK
ncbi:MAG: hypothetical protein HC859_17635 [Bacteroidia bacterium]|nr:hypothetical protein [Bacteroidia bacterium]